MTAGIIAALVGWGTFAGLDLVSLLQSLFSRPLVAGAGAGWLLGDVEGGLRIGTSAVLGDVEEEVVRHPKRIESQRLD